MRGFFSIGVWHSKYEINIGGLLRSAACFGAAYVFTVGRRYERQASDTMNTAGSIPLLHFTDLVDLVNHLPHSCPLVGVELAAGAEPLNGFSHPPAACYLLGAEDHGLSPNVLSRCHKKVVIGGLTACLNVASAGTCVMYDRWVKRHPVRILEGTSV